MRGGSKRECDAAGLAPSSVACKRLPPLGDHPLTRADDIANRLKAWWAPVRKRQLRRDIHRAQSEGTFSRSIFTYDADAFQDGMGAQLHRIFGVYALARAAGAHYLHTPIKALKFAGISTPDNPSAVEDLIVRSGRIFRLPDDAWSVANAGGASVHSISDARIANMVPLATASDRPTLFKICLPHRHLDLAPDLWTVIAPAVGLERAEEGPLRVALHVRRGELHFVDSQRMLPNSYYLAVAERLERLLRSASIPFRFELYTEAVATPTTIGRERFFDPTRASDQVLRPDHDRLDDFASLSPLDRFINLDAIETLLRLATADVLVTSRSSFSFVAGVLAPEKLVLYAPFWHSPMPGWLVTDRFGRFDERSARNHVLRQFATRQQPR